MPNFVLETRATPFQVVYPSGNSTNQSIIAPVALDGPTGDGMIETGGAAVGCNGLLLMPYGAGDAGLGFAMMVFGWRRVVSNLQVQRGGDLWIPYPLAAFRCTLAQVLGVDKTVIPASNLFCTMGSIAGNPGFSHEVITTGGFAPDYVVLDVKGAQRVTVLFGTGFSAQSCNCLAAKV